MSEADRLRRLPASLVNALRPVRDAARSSGTRVALVGGAVRDRLLERPIASRDVDVAVEGDAAELARRIARSDPRVAVRIHERFGTATVETPGGRRIDLAGTRSETYRRPGALPEVAPATLEEDLARRDFTVNAMALELLPPGSRRPRLLDPLGGAADVRARRIRALHPESFRDDPTRALRAVRYANRLGFRVEPQTRRWLSGALASGALDTISGDRLRREIEKLLAEGGAARAVALVRSLGVARAIHPELERDGGPARGLARAERLVRSAPGATSWLMPFLVWTDGLSSAARASVADRLSLAGPARRIFDRWPETRRVLLAGASPASARAGADERVAAAAVWPPGAGRAAGERRLLSGAPALSIRGADLLEAGVAAGPRVGRALAETRLALEEGRIAPREELSYALAAARRKEP